MYRLSIAPGIQKNELGSSSGRLIYFETYDEVLYKRPNSLNSGTSTPGTSVTARFSILLGLLAKYARF